MSQPIESPRGAVNLYPATKERLRRVALDMREADEREVRAMCGASPWTGLDRSVELSEEAYVAEAPDGTPLFAFGVAPYVEVAEGPTGLLWMLGTNAVKDYPRALIAAARWFLPKAVVKWPGGLGNCIGDDNELHLNFVARLGAILRDADKFERGDVTFVPFLLTPANLEV